MKKEDIINQRHKVLEKIQDDMNEHLIAAQLVSPETEETPEVLNVVLDGIGFEGEEAIGEFCFIPMASDEAEVQYFTSVISIADEIEDDTLSALFEAMSYINFSVTCGSFSIDMNHSFLVYKLTVPMPVDISDETLYDQVNLYMGTATAMADQYMDLLLRMIEKELTLDDIITALK